MVAEKKVISVLVAVINFISCVSHVLIKSVFTVRNIENFDTSTQNPNEQGFLGSV
jgi:hypothetical protein